MKKLSKLFLHGLFAILPLTVTLFLLYWLGTTIESVLGGLFKWVLPESWYVPGMGLLAGFLFILTIGILLNAYLFRAVSDFLEKLFIKLPLVRTIYGSVRDIAKFASASQNKQGLQKAVAITLDNDLHLIGFVTREAMTLGKHEDLVAVYLPMSYQIGGYTLMVPKSRIEPLEMSTQDAMRLVLTAAVTGVETP